MTLRVQILARDFSQRNVILAMPGSDSMALKVVSYSQKAIGGPSQAKMTGTGSRHTLMDYLGKLRCPVEIYDDYDQVVWCGYVSEISLKIGSITIGVSLDSMYNRITSIGADTAPGVVTSVINPTIDDPVSQAEYGIKQLYQTASNLSRLQLHNLQGATLDQKKYPIPTIQIADPNQPDGVTIYCRGWWDTLSWQYYGNALGLWSYTDGGGGKATIGDVADSTKAAQLFQTTPVGWTATSVKLRLCKTGSPVDNLVIDLCADNSGVPGTVLATATIAGGNVPAAMDWVQADFAGPYALAGLTSYWLKLSRDGGIHAGSYYWCGLDTGYAPPTGYKEWNGFNWITRAKDADGHLLMQVIDNVETTAQIVAIVAAQGQFLAGTEIEDASGVYSCEYRDGTSQALSEISALLKSGTTNNRRLLAQVSDARILRLYEEPASSELEYILRKDGSITNMAGSPVEAYLCPVGAWMLVQEAVDFQVGFMADPTRVFAEEMEYTAASNSLKLTPREMQNPLDAIGGLQ